MEVWNSVWGSLPLLAKRRLKPYALNYACHDALIPPESLNVTSHVSNYRAVLRTEDRTPQTPGVLSQRHAAVT